MENNQGLFNQIGVSEESTDRTLVKTIHFDAPPISTSPQFSARSVTILKDVTFTFINGKLECSTCLEPDDAAQKVFDAITKIFLPNANGWVSLRARILAGKCLSDEIIHHFKDENFAAYFNSFVK